MAYLNKVMLIGNVGKDPERRMTQNGKARATFSIATSRRYRDNNGEQKEDTTWHNIVAWGKSAELLEQLGVTKGTSLYIEGTLSNRQWSDPTSGTMKYITEINMENFQLLTPRGQGGNSYSPQNNPYSQQARQNAQRNANMQTEDMGGYNPDDDLPF